MIGQSISGSTIKEYERVNSSYGIVFYSHVSMGYMRSYGDPEPVKRISNIYSGGFQFVTGMDPSFRYNGELPNYFSDPTVYVAATCDAKDKYRTFCSAVLEQDEKSGSHVFFELQEAYRSSHFKVVV